MENAFDNKSIQDSNKPVYNEVATEDILGIILEQLVTRANEEVEVHIPLEELHEDTIHMQ